jgi:hypothetical protein
VIDFMVTDKARRWQVSFQQTILHLPAAQFGCGY